METDLQREPLSSLGAATSVSSVALVTTGLRTSVVVPGRLLRLAGRLDVAAAADVRLAIAQAVDGGLGELVLDVADLTALDATGLGVLVGGHRRAQRAARVLVLRDVSPPVARLLFLTRLDKVLRTSRTAVVA